jgi:hypothetical protein
MPIKGAFQIRCVMPDGTENTTVDLWHSYNLGWIRDRIIAACPYYMDKFELSDGNAFNYYDDGRDILIRFTYLNMDIP